MRPFAARLNDEVYDQLRKRAAGERRSMNAVLNDSLEQHFRGRSDAKAALLRALAALEESERSGR